MLLQLEINSFSDNLAPPENQKSQRGAVFSKNTRSALQTINAWSSSRLCGSDKVAI
jgi:hypothetical protein